MEEFVILVDQKTCVFLENRKTREKRELRPSEWPKIIKDFGGKKYLESQYKERLKEKSLLDRLFRSYKEHRSWFGFLWLCSEEGTVAMGHDMLRHEDVLADVNSKIPVEVSVSKHDDIFLKNKNTLEKIKVSPSDWLLVVKMVGGNELVEEISSTKNVSLLGRVFNSWRVKEQILEFFRHCEEKDRVFVDDGTFFKVEPGATPVVKKFKPRP